MRRPRLYPTMRPFFRFAFPLLLVVAAVVASLAAGRARAELKDLGRAPDYRLQTLDGRELTSASLRGKVVVVDFWATWCPPCIEEIPGYIELEKKHGPEGLVIIGVSMDRRGPAHVRQFAQRMGITYALVMGNDEIADAFGGFDALPTTLLIDREGRIRHRKVGAMHHDEYEKLIKPLL